MSENLKRKGRLLRLVMFFMFLSVFGGCVYSGAYHVQMFQGHVTPRPFPVVRYWAEHTRDQYVDMIFRYALPLGPGFHLGYIGDLVIDTLFFPIDLTMSYWAKQPELKVVPLEDGNPNGPYRLELYAATSALHCEYALYGKEGPLLIDVKKGSLSLYQARGTLDEKLLMNITPEKQREIIDNISQFSSPKIEAPGGPTKLEMYMEAIPARWDFRYLVCGSVTSLLIDADELYSGYYLNLTHADRSGGCPRVVPQWYDISGNMEDGGSMQRITLVPSPDFVGSCTYKGKTVSEIWFIHRPDWPSSEE